jgi:hypothetical protein
MLYQVSGGFGVTLGGIIVTYARSPKLAIQRAKKLWEKEYPNSPFKVEQAQATPLDVEKGPQIIWNGDY